MRRILLSVICLVVAGCSRDAVRPAPSPAPTDVTASPDPTTTPAPDVFQLAKRYDARTPVELAAALEDAERAIRDGGTDRGTLAEHARVQQAAYRQVVRQPEWRPDVTAALPVDLRDVADLNIESGLKLRRLTDPREELPPWKIVEPPPADELRTHYGAAENEFGIDWTYLAAIHLVETRMGRIRGDSTAGARGPMQFLPQTWEAYGEGDINDARDAIRAAARYLKAHGAPADMGRALFAYNHSNLYVDAVRMYARVMQEDERAYLGYYHWDVYYRTTDGDALLYVGWPSR